MELYRCFSRLNVARRQIHTSCVSMSMTWRKQKGLPVNKTTCGPLTDLPDYKYLDGRPTPLGSHQHNRMLQQQEFAQKMVRYIHEVDFAKDRYQKKLEMKANKKKLLMENKLKDKGSKLSKTL